MGRLLLWFFVAVVAAVALDGCAGPECQFNTDCPRGYCVSNSCHAQCHADRDCNDPSTPFCDVNGRCVAIGADAGTDAPHADVRDTGSGMDVMDVVTVLDVPITPDVPIVPDVPVTPDVPIISDVAPPVDTGTHGTGVYLDGCSLNTDCASGMCNTASGYPSFCTRACSTNTDCAQGQVCARGQCYLDDTGRTPCNTTTAAPCLSYCYGTSTFATCTKDCSTPDDCPAGFACAAVSGHRICIDVEIPCTDVSQCPSATGFCAAGGLGCTVPCASAADCPNTITGVPSYTCAPISGITVCVPPTGVTGSQPIGTSCPTTGLNSCRSEACDTSAAPPDCTERCTTRGGCGPGFGCFPDSSSTPVELVCKPAPGSAWLGASCAHASECYTGLCQSPGYCTRLCVDGLCPTGMTCMDSGLSASDGTSIRLCSH